MKNLKIIVTAILVIVSLKINAMNDGLVMNSTKNEFSREDILKRLALAEANLKTGRMRRMEQQEEHKRKIKEKPSEFYPLYNENKQQQIEKYLYYKSQYDLLKIAEDKKNNAKKTRPKKRKRKCPKQINNLLGQSFCEEDFKIHLLDQEEAKQDTRQKGKERIRYNQNPNNFSDDALQKKLLQESILAEKILSQYAKKEETTHLNFLEQILNSTQPVDYNTLQKKYIITDINRPENYDGVSQNPIHCIFNNKHLFKDSMSNLPGDNVERYKTKQRKIACAIEALINMGAKINLRDGNGNTPLHYAMLQENYEAVEHLINNNANPNISNNEGDTPLLFALKKIASRESKDIDPFSQKHFYMEKCVEKILLSKTRPTFTDRNNDGESVLSILKSNKKDNKAPMLDTIRGMISADIGFIKTKEIDEERNSLRRTAPVIGAVYNYFWPLSSI